MGALFSAAQSPGAAAVPVILFLGSASLPFITPRLSQRSIEDNNSLRVRLVLHLRFLFRGYTAFNYETFYGKEGNIRPVCCNEPFWDNASRSGFGTPPIRSPISQEQPTELSEWTFRGIFSLTEGLGLDGGGHRRRVSNPECSNQPRLSPSHPLLCRLERVLGYETRSYGPTNVSLTIISHGGRFV